MVTAVGIKSDLSKTTAINQDVDECSILNPYEMYHSSITLWRHRITLDITIVHHPRERCYEVLAFDPNAKKENESLIFICQDKITACVKASPEMDKVKESFLRRRSSSQNIDQLKSKALVDLIGSYIVKRIAVIEGKSEVLNVFLQPHFGDEIDSTTNKLCLQIEKPPGIIPFKKQRRNSSSLVEFDLAVLKIKHDTQEASESCIKAQHFSDVIRLTLDQSAAEFTRLLETRKKRMQRSSNFSNSKKRWKLAIRKVILQARVSKTKDYLNELKIKKEAELLPSIVQQSSQLYEKKKLARSLSDSSDFKLAKISMPQDLNESLGVLLRSKSMLTKLPQIREN